MSFVVLVESSRLKECVAYLFSFHISKNKKNTLFKGAKVPSPLNGLCFKDFIGSSERRLREWFMEDILDVKSCLDL